MSLAERLEVKIASHSRAIDRLIYTQEMIGTPNGPKRLNLKDAGMPEDVLRNTPRVVMPLRKKKINIKNTRKIL